MDREDQAKIVDLQDKIREHLNVWPTNCNGIGSDRIFVAEEQNNVILGHLKMFGRIFMTLDDMLDDDLRWQGPRPETWAVVLMGLEYDGDNWVESGGRYTEEAAKSIAATVGGVPTEVGA